MYIILGMDNTGKTTLAKELSQSMGLPIVNSCGPNHTKSEKMLWVLDQLVREGLYPSFVIHERFLPFEEMVYGPILRDGSIYSLEHIHLQELRLHNPMIIYVRPSDERILNFGSRAQMAGVIDKAQELLSAWDSLIFKMVREGWHVVYYDYDSQMVCDGGIREKGEIL